MSHHKTFCAFGAYAVNVTNPAATVVMPLPNAAALGRPLKPAKYVTLNLSKRLKSVAWDEVLLDTMGLDEEGEDLEPQPSYPSGAGINILTFGPVFPGQRNHVGGIYLERSKFYAEVRPLIGDGKADWPQPGLERYELMSSARFVDGTVIARFHGFHATVIEDHGPVKRLQIKRTGDPKLITVDLLDRGQCDDPSALAIAIQDPAYPTVSAPVLDVGAPKDAQGAIFLSLKTCVDNFIAGPKEPIGAGD